MVRLRIGLLRDTVSPLPMARAPFTMAETSRPLSWFTALPPWASKVWKNAPPAPIRLTDTNASLP